MVCGSRRWKDRSTKGQYRGDGRSRAGGGVCRWLLGNGMGAELAVMSGAGKIVLDVRRGDGPEICFDYTLPTLATSDRLIESNPDAVRGAVRAIAATLKALSDDVSLATKAARSVFPQQETDLIAELIRRDLPFYDPIDFRKDRLQ